MAAGLGHRAGGCENLGFKPGWPLVSTAAEILAALGRDPFPLWGSQSPEFLPGEAFVGGATSAWGLWDK